MYTMHKNYISTYGSNHIMETVESQVLFLQKTGVQMDVLQTDF